MSDTHRMVSLQRTAAGQLLATNVRGGTLRIGGSAEDFSPVELLLVAMAACTALDVDTLTSRRSEPDAFTVEAHGEKVREEDGNRMRDLSVVFRVSFPEGPDGDAARAVLPEAVRKSHERWCAVGRTVQLGTEISVRVEQ
jgi:putative redox protein